MANGDVVGSARIRIEADGSGLQRQNQSILGQFRGLAAGITAIFAGIRIARFIQDGIQEIAELDTAIREVGTLLGPEAVELGALDDIRAGVQDLALEFGTLSDVAVPAVYQAISAGVPQANVFNFLEDANRAAIAGVTDLETAVTTIAGITNAYGTDVLSAADASDILFTTISGGITNFDQLGASLSQVTPTAAALGIGFDEVGAAMATITQQGVPTSQAATSLNQVFAELGRGSTEVAGLFEELSGQSFPDFIASGGSVQEALQLLDTEARSSGQSMLDLFGSVEAGRAALLLTGSSADLFAEQLEAMGDRAGATDDAFEIMSDGIEFAIGRLSGHFEAVRQGFFDAFGPVVLARIDQLLPVIESLLPLIGGLGVNVVGAFEPLTPALVDIIETLSGPLIQSLSAVAEATAVLAGAVGPAASLLAQTLAPSLQVVADILDALPAEVLAVGLGLLALRGPLLAFAGFVTAASASVGAVGAASLVARAGVFQLSAALTVLRAHPVLFALAGIALAFGTAARASDDFKFSAGQVDEALLDLERSGTSVVVDQLADAMGRLDNTVNILGVRLSTEWGSGLGDGTKAANEFNEIVGDLDTGLTSLVTGGNADSAAASIEGLGRQLDLSGDELAEFVEEHFPKYIAELERVEAENQRAAESVDPLVEAQQRLGEQLGATGEEAVQVAQEFVDAWTSAAERFFDVSGAFAQVVDEINAEQARIAEEAGNTEEQVLLSLEDVITGYEGATERITEILTEQVQAQAEWSANMALLAERVSTDVLEQLQRLGPEGAPFVADLVDQTDAELAASTMPFVAQGLTDEVASVLATANWSDPVASADARILRQLLQDFGQGEVEASDFVSQVEAILAAGDPTLEGEFEGAPLTEAQQMVADFQSFLNGNPVTAPVQAGELTGAQQQVANFQAFLNRNPVTVPVRAGSPGFGVLPFGADGGIFDRPTPIIIGEAGREVLLPLTDQQRTLQLAQDSGLTNMLVGALTGRSRGGSVGDGALPSPAVRSGADRVENNYHTWNITHPNDNDQVLANRIARRMFRPRL